MQSAIDSIVDSLRLCHSTSLSLLLSLSLSLFEFIVFCFLSCLFLLLWFEALDNLQPQFGKALIDAEAGKKQKNDRQKSNGA